MVEASGKGAAAEVLKNYGLFVTALEEFSPPIYARRIRFLQHISKKDIVFLSRQLAIMFKSKVPLIEIFQTLAKQTKNVELKEKILKLSEEVEGGTPLSKALSLFPKLFSPFYTSMVKSGEASGKLTDVFLYLADYLEKDHLFRSKIRGALTYPIFVIFVAAVVVTIIVTYVIPQLTSVLTETGAQLPWITRLVISSTDFLRAKGWMVLLVLIGLGYLFYRYYKTPKGKEVVDRITLKVPGIGGFLKKLYLARFALNLSTLISGGLPIVQALEITSEVMGNVVYRNVILQTKEDVKKGETISSVLERYPHAISPLFYQMVVVGEKTGTLDTSLLNIVDFYQKDVDRSLDDFIKLLEPLLIIVLGIVVGGLMAAVLLPIYSMGLGD